MAFPNLLKTLVLKLLDKNRPVSKPTSTVSDIEEARRKAEEARKQADAAREAARQEKIKALQALMPAKPKNRTQAAEMFGAINDTWPDEGKHMALFQVPELIAQKWINSATGKPTTKIYCNKAMHKPLLAALKLLEERGLTDELKTFDGCYQIRKVRGSTASLSWHSWGLAIDVNAKDNGLGVEPKLSKEFVQCWKDAGWIWGGDFTRKDGMHFQWAEG